jgi:putative redox protein
MHLEYTVTGDVPAQAVQRAIDLSREKYCSAWHSLRQDIELSVTFAIVAG